MSGNLRRTPPPPPLSYQKEESPQIEPLAETIYVTIITEPTPSQEVALGNGTYPMADNDLSQEKDIPERVSLAVLGMAACQVLHREEGWGSQGKRGLESINGRTPFS